MDGTLGSDFAEVLDNDFAMGDGVAFGAPLGSEAGVGAAAVHPPHQVAGQGNGGGSRLQWTNVMSGFVLRRFSELVAKGVRTDKGFKDVHLNAVARDLSEFVNIEVSGTQVYNHLRKWRSKWVKICRLKELSSAGWDEENYAITLDPDHYNDHVKDHPKDAEFLNTHLINYPQMQTIFASGAAIGRFSMDSNEPLGQPVTPDTIDVDVDVPLAANDEAPEVGTKGKKRKRGLNDEDRDRRPCDWDD